MAISKVETILTIERELCSATHTTECKLPSTIAASGVIQELVCVICFVTRVEFVAATGVGKDAD